ncbi:MULTISPECIES: hypothetical protein [Mycobacterium]|nr:MULTISPECIES: hypothetical protein [Mycobacterium]QNI09780.1 hypothetical protein GAN17_25655 [Mycobacterium kubicae]
MCAIPGQRSYSGADLRCRRGALGLPEQDAAMLLNAPVAALRAWEATAVPQRELSAVIDRLSRVERTADHITTHLSAEATRTGRITTFRTDTGAAAAGAPTGVAVLHRICAGRAWESHRDATLVLGDVTQPAVAEPDRRAELMIRLTMLALTRNDIEQRLGLGHRRIQQWIRGDSLIPDGIFTDLDTLEQAADKHTETLEETTADTGCLQVAATVTDLLAAYPATQNVALSTHWAAAGVLLSDDNQLRAHWIGSR